MENKENNQDFGLELLKKVIETNERNIEQGIKAEFAFEDLLSLKGKTDSSLQGMNAMYLKLVESLEKEKQEREIFLEKIPKTIDVIIPETTLKQFKAFEKKFKAGRYLFFGSIGILILSIITIFSVGKLAKNWYSESIKTKTEIRQEILTEIENEGKSIYKTSDLEQLKTNTVIMNKWMHKNPKEAESFLKFKDGFESR